LVFLRSVRRLLVTASVVPSSPILVTLMKEALSYSETSFLTRATRRNIQEDAILHSHSREYLKSYLFRTKGSLITFGPCVGRKCHINPLLTSQTSVTMIIMAGTSSRKSIDIFRGIILNLEFQIFLRYKNDCLNWS
jgi:hypothetical protein